MTRPNYGPQAKKRAKRLLEVLLAYANDELQFDDQFPVQVNWQTEKQLVVRTKVRFLEELTALDNADGKLNKEQIKEALKRFEDFLKILEDNRTTTRGAEDWHFTLKLWHKRQDKAANLAQFEVEWERCRPQKSKQLTGGASVLPTNDLNASKHQDWGEAVDVSIFYGRIEELATLEQWIVQERCRLVALLGMGGIGKTSLVVKLAQQVQEKFEYIIWRSLRNAPPIKDILAELILFLSDGQETNLPETVEGRISRLIYFFRKYRVLAILDNVESILQSGERAGNYGEGYEEYGEFIKKIGELTHQSCLVLTSREKIKEVALQEGVIFPVRSLCLSGLNQVEGQEIFKAKGDFSGLAEEWKVVIQHYAGNPLALKMVASAVQDLFDGNISELIECLKSESLIFDDIRNLLERQLNRLSALEKEVMYWLAIKRELVSFSELQLNLLSAESKQNLFATIQSLWQRSLIEKHAGRLTQQPVVMEYMTERLIEQISHEIGTEKLSLLMSHALIKAQAKDYIRESNFRVILKPITDRLYTLLKSKENVKTRLDRITFKLKESLFTSRTYAAGNIINLLNQLEIDLAGYDFSHSNIWQAFLQNVNLHQVDFAYCDLAKSVFAKTFSSILSLAFSPDGKFLATSDTDCEIRIWQIPSGEQLFTCKGHFSWVWSVTFSPDGQTLASAGDDQTVRLWDVSTGLCLKILSGHTDYVRAVAFSPDSQILASSSDDQTVKLWDVYVGQCLNTLQGHINRVHTVAFSPDGQTLASGSSDHTIRLWDIRTKQCRKILQGHISWVRAVAFSPDGQILASSSNDQKVKLWDVYTGQCLKTLQGHTNSVLSVAFGPKNSILISGSYDRTVRLWDINVGQCLKTLQGHTNLIFSVAFSSDGQTLASGSDDQTVRLWDADTGQCLKTLQGHTNSVFSIAFTSDGQTLASSGDDRTVKLWDVSTGRCLKTLSGHSNRVWSVAFSQDSQTLACCSSDRTIRLWDVGTGRCLKTLSGHTSWVWHVTFSPQGKTLASCSEDKTIKLWDADTGQCLKTLEGHASCVRTATFSPDGSILISGSYDQTLRLWDVSTGQCIKILSGHTNAVLSVALGCNGQTLASRSSDYTVKLWNIQTHQHLKTLLGHNNQVWSVAFSPDGQTLASSGDDETIRLWDVSTGQCIKTLLGHNKLVSSVTFSPDSKTLASSSLDETIKLWEIETGKCLETWRAQRIYEGMNITGITGLTEGAIADLKALGAVEY